MLLSDFLTLGKEPGGPAACQASGLQISEAANKSQQVMKNAGSCQQAMGYRAPLWLGLLLAVRGSASGQVARPLCEGSSSSLDTQI